MGIKEVFMKDETKRKYKVVDIELLHSGLAYQRPIDKSFVEDKVINFNENEVDPPKVSYRDGKYNVVDGQHTITICKSVGWKKIRCEIREGLTVAEENEWFVITNTKHRPQSKNRILNGRYYSGSDEKLNTLITCLSAVGYKLRTPDIQDTFGVISASDTIENIFSELGKESFLDLITLHSAIWNGDKLSLQASFFKRIRKILYDIS